VQYQDGCSKEQRAKHSKWQSNEHTQAIRTTVSLGLVARNQNMLAGWNGFQKMVKLSASLFGIAEGWGCPSAPCTGRGGRMQGMSAV